MTVRDFIQEILLNAPDLDAEVYIQTVNGVDIKDFVIDKITNGGSNDGIFIEIKDWIPEMIK